ncbi:MAG: NAD(P)H-dependent glycerol-3-phosphate dehydrogenase [Nannocystaceae bacterium]
MIGSGSWGTALAIHAARRGHPVRLWARTPERAQQMQQERVNARYLKDAPFPDGLAVTSELGEALDAADLVIMAVPSHGLRAVTKRVADTLKSLPATRPSFLIAAKGVEVDSLKTMAAVLAEELEPVHHAKIAALGGPSFAAEVAGGQPTVVVVACKQIDVAEEIQIWLSGNGVRVYVTDDVTGVELGGAFKNVIALAAGVCDGAGLGQNARAALITRGLAEISRLSVTLGALPTTLAGLAGLGDLVLTCTGGLSRNRRVGLALGQGQTLEQILEEMGMVAEGVKNTLSAQRLAAREGIEMPIANMMHALLYGGASVKFAVASLMGRDLKSERE